MLGKKKNPNPNTNKPKGPSGPHGGLEAPFPQGSPVLSRSPARGLGSRGGHSGPGRALPFPQPLSPCRRLPAARSPAGCRSLADGTGAEAGAVPVPIPIRAGIAAPGQAGARQPLPLRAGRPFPAAPQRRSRAQGSPPPLSPLLKAPAYLHRRRSSRSPASGGRRHRGGGRWSVVPAAVPAAAASRLRSAGRESRGLRQPAPAPGLCCAVPGRARLGYAGPCTPAHAASDTLCRASPSCRT